MFHGYVKLPYRVDDTPEIHQAPTHPGSPPMHTSPGPVISVALEHARTTVIIEGDGSKPWYLVNPKIAGKWMFIPLKMYL